jgi:signal peptidase I
MKLPPRLRKILKEHVKPLALILIVLCSFRSAIADWNVVPTGSMNPTILEGDHIVVNKLAYGLRVPFTMWHVMDWSAPARGDVIVFMSPADGERLVKRVIGLPGDTISMRDECLTINGRSAGYPALAGEIAALMPPAPPHVFAAETIDGQSHPVMATPALPAQRSFGPITVPAGHYFVLGDNRDNSADSRYIGFIPAKNVLGRSSRVGYSLDPSNWYLPRWGRTLEALP